MEDMYRDGYVYLIEWGGIYKIGRSYNPVQRLYQVRKGSGDYPYARPSGDPTLVCCIKTSDSAQLERSLHLHFQTNRLSPGEWFQLGVQDVAWFQQQTPASIQAYFDERIAEQSRRWGKWRNR